MSRTWQERRRQPVRHGTVVRARRRGHAGLDVQKVIASQRQWASRVAALQHTVVVTNERAYQHYFPAADSAGSQP